MPEKSYSRKNVINQALGALNRVEINTIKLLPGDKLLLETDGLHGMISDQQIEDILMAADDDLSAIGDLLAAANKAGGGDNITAVLISEEADKAALEIVKIKERIKLADIDVSKNKGNWDSKQAEKAAQAIMDLPDNQPNQKANILSTYKNFKFIGRTIELPLI